ncbi:MAG: Crp/Fnr family transcriptional regulator [Bacteroidota bacterium]
MEDRQLLYNIFTQDGLRPADIETVVTAFRLLDIKKGEYLLQAGNLAQHYYFVQDGFFRSFAVDPQGNEVTTNFYGPGQMILDAPSFLLRQPTREYFQATEDASCWVLGYERFQELFDSIDAFRNAGRSRLVQGYFALKNRSLSMITDNAKDRYLQLLAAQPEILQRAQLKHIASYLGVTDTSLSRIRREVSKG